MKKKPEEKTRKEKDLHLYLKISKRKIDSKWVISNIFGLENIINELHQTTPSTKT